MRAGYDFETYRALCAARAQIPEGTRVGLPFVSVAGPNYGAAIPKILYVGKSPWATEEESPAIASHDEYEASLAWSSYWLGRQSVPSTAFWDFAAKVVRAVMPEIREPATSYLAWSNLAKVAQIDRGAPDKDVSECMRIAECAALTAELSRFRPDLVVLVSNDAVWNVATTVFGNREAMTTYPDGTWTCSDPRGFALYWTRHPQATSLEWRTEHADRIRNLIKP